MTWNPFVNPIDFVLFAGKRTPGLADVVGPSSPREWEERRGYGLSGARLRFLGLKLSHFSVKLRLYTAQDWTDWQKFRPIVAKPPLGKRPKAIDIAHPILVDIGIRAVVIEDVGGAEQTDDGEWSIEIKLIEWRKLKPSLSTPDGATATPVDPIEQKIAENTKTIAQLLAAP